MSQKIKKSLKLVSIYKFLEEPDIQPTERQESRATALDISHFFKKKLLQ